MVKKGGKWSEKYKKSINCKNPKGFSQKAHCQGRKKKNKLSPTKTKSKTYFEKYDLYSDANPKDTVRVKYKTLQELKDTIKKLENLYKTGKKSHARIVQIANVLKQRLRVINEKTGKGVQRYKLSSRYFDFLKERTKKKGFDERKKLKFFLSSKKN